ncbi:MAG: ABC-type Fe3+ transport system periplasmic component [Chloroflexi bacterium]|nr:ABC-type Fe3+ transport system periplasmic component [Chloroflexota bacterium]
MTYGREPDDDRAAFQSAPRLLGRRAFLGEVGIGAAALALTACTPSAPSGRTAATPAAASQSEAWDRVVEAARREGSVWIYGASIGRESSDALVDPFEAAFPGVSVEGVFGPADQSIAKITSERTAGRYLADILIGPGSSGIPALKPLGVLAPIKPTLMLPEVLDGAGWLDGHLWWIDAAEPYTALMYQGTIQPIVEYNTAMVPAGTFKSYWDLLDPRWKGRIVVADVTSGGSIQQLTFLYKHPDLGPGFLERLFGEMSLTVSRDQRQSIDWVAQGQYPVGLFLSSSQTIAAASQGLQIAIVPGYEFKEGAPLGAGGGAVMLIDRAPHPNASTLYLNWLLSRDGQSAWQKATQQNSLRVDIPKDGLSPFTTPRPGGQYVNAGSEAFARIDDRTAAEVVNALVVKALAQG